jgi:3-methyladenine DNA glycosylase AlkD
MDIIPEIRKELKKHVDVEYRDGAIRFFNEPVECYGVRTPIVRQIGRQYWKQVKDLSKNKVFELCEKLYKSNIQEETIIATMWVRKHTKDLKPSDFNTFERWIDLYFNNWAKIDDFCTHPMNMLLGMYPELITKTKKWTGSKNRWVRRASAVSLIGRNKMELEHVFWVAEKMMMDSDDLVQKGYGWMLKVAADTDQKAVHKFVLKHKDCMPRTALRYAIEKMPPDLKKKAMQK